ncbi:MAG: hypothetical protein AAB593_01885 [Patescibacteria group bacterium]
MAYAKPIQNVIDLLQKLPSIGPKTAEQYAFALQKLPKQDLKELSLSINALINIKKCINCGKAVENILNKQCEICETIVRKTHYLMIIKSEMHLEQVEKTKKYNGRYFIFKNTEANLKRLIEIIKTNKIKELILAFDMTPNDEVNIFNLKHKLKKILGKNLPEITRLGRGLPSGGDLRYADNLTIESALEHREII